MTTRDEDGGLGAEVSSRLDELFGDDESEPTPASMDASDAVSVVDDSEPKTIHPASAGAEVNDGDIDADSPIRNLKALVFSIDWEITDKTMVDFLAEIKRLQQKYKNDQILSFFLKLHESIGKYIKAKKARAHPDAIKFVASVYKSFEKVLTSPKMNEREKKQLLSSEVKKFKDFKQRIVLGEGAGEPLETVVTAEVKEDAPARGVSLSLESKEALDYIVEQIKKEIKAEFHTMRQIIKNLGA